jgi:hypothetical protein
MVLLISECSLRGTPERNLLFGDWGVGGVQHNISGVTILDKYVVSKSTTVDIPSMDYRILDTA